MAKDKIILASTPRGLSPLISTIEKMRSTEEIFEEEAKKTMKSFNLQEFKRTHPHLLLSIQKAMIAYSFTPSGQKSK